MRGSFLALMALIVISGSLGSVFSINNVQTTLNRGDNLTITYQVSLNAEEETNYAITLGGVQIINETRVMKDASGTFNYNVSEVPAGTYQLFLVVKSPSISITENSGKNITILKDVGLRVDVPSTAYITGAQSTLNAELRNVGNTNLSITTYIKNALSDASVSPQSFLLRNGENKILTITIAKPSSDYNATLVISANNDEIKREFQILVTTPNINVTIQNVTVKEENNNTIINTEIRNEGNMDVNATIKVSLFSISEGFKTINQTVSLPMNETTASIITTSYKGVTGVSVLYNNGTNNVEVESKLGGAMPLNINLSEDKLVIIAIIVVVVIMYFYFKSKRKQRP